MNTILHLAAVLASLWASVFAFQTLEEPALGGAMLVLFFAFIAMTVAALHDDLFLVSGRKMLGFRGNEREPISVASKIAISSTVVFLFVSTFFSSLGTSTAVQDVDIKAGVAIGQHDAASQTPLAVNRIGGRFQESRASVDEGDDVGFRVDSQGHQLVGAQITSPVTAFGEVSTAVLSPQVQVDFPYSNNPRIMQTLLGGTGAVAVANTLATLSTGTDTNSHVFFSTIREVKYHMGQGVQVRLAAAFDAAGAAGTDAIIGLGGEEDLLGFGYDETVFGILHRMDGKRDIQTLTVTTGAVTAGGTITINLNSVGFEVEVVNGDSVQSVARAIGAVAMNQWLLTVAGDTVIFVHHTAGDLTGTFSLVDTDTTGVVGAFAESVEGVTQTDTWIAQTDWNDDNLDGDGDSANPSGMLLVPGNGNTYEVEYQDGFGDIIFSVENQATGKFIMVHRISYTNQFRTANIQNPTLPLMAIVNNKATTSNVGLIVSSMAGFTEGPESFDGSLNAATQATASGDLTTETCILALFNKLVYQGVDNRVDFFPQLITFSAAGAGAAKFTTLKIVVNPILGGPVTFTDISTPTSVMSVATNGTTVTGGNVIGSFEFGADVSGFLINLDAISQPQPPGTLACFTVQTDGGTTDADVGVIWKELF